MLPRKIFKTLKEQKDDKKISLLLGPRQVGKTTLLRALYEEYSKKHICLFLDIDILSNFEKVSTFENAINTFKLNGYQENQKDFLYVFLDEFQKYPVLTTIMKNIYDTFTNIKIYASGSSSLMIKNQVQESLAGRKKMNEVFPLDFEEYLWFLQNPKNIEKYQNAKKIKGDDLHKVVGDLQKELFDFLVFGGYPEVALKKTKQEKIEVLESIFDLYVKKDLVEYLKIEKILNVKKLIEYCAVNNGQKIKYEEIAQLTQLSYREIKEYIELLTQTYILTVVKPFHTNKNKELVKIPKIYFIDSGVRNYFIQNFNHLSVRNDGSFLFEGHIISELTKRGHKELKFWQDKNKNEIDIIMQIESKQLPIEVKFKEKLKSDDFISLRLFKEEYPKAKKTFLVNMSSQKEIKGVSLLLPYSLDKIA